MPFRESVEEIRAAYETATGLGDTLKNEDGEWHASCPLCEGVDRFWFRAETGGTVVNCRQCGESTGKWMADIRAALGLNGAGGGGTYAPPKPRKKPNDIPPGVELEKPPQDMPPEGEKVGENSAWCKAELDKRRQLWPFKVSADTNKAAYWFETEDDGHLLEVRFVDRTGKTTGRPVRLSKWGEIIGLKPGEYYWNTQHKDASWRPVKLDSDIPPDTPRKWLTEARPRLFEIDRAVELAARPDCPGSEEGKSGWILFTEGAKDAATGLELGFPATARHGSVKLDAAMVAPLKGQRVAIPIDRDTNGAGERYGQERAQAAFDAGALEVRVLLAFKEPDGSIPTKKGYDLTDLVESSHRAGVKDIRLRRDLLAAINRAKPFAPPPPKARKKKKAPPAGSIAAAALPANAVILEADSEMAIARQALRLVMKDGREDSIYKRAGRLIMVIRADDNTPTKRRIPQPTHGTPIICPMPVAKLRAIMSDRVRFFMPPSEDGVCDEKKHPPGWCISEIIDDKQWSRHELSVGPVPELAAIVEGPTFLEDGSILQAPGYHEESGLLYIPSGEFEPVPEKPTQEQVHQAVKLLREVVCNFPFKTEAHFSAWVSALMTAAVRHAIPGNVPMHIIDANVPGAGKTLLGDTIVLIVTGRHAAKWSYSGARNPDETEKQITTAALEGLNTIFYDNVRGKFGDQNLDLALTSSTWKGRRLGHSESTKDNMPLRVTWLATGNNVEPTGELSRRALMIRLQTDLENPERRSPDNFLHGDLEEWIPRERPRILPAVLTIMRGWHVAGRPVRPKTSGDGWGSFDAWAKIVLGAITWAGLPDPTCTREELVKQDTRLDTQRDLLAGLAVLMDGEPMTASDILKRLVPSEDGQSSFPSEASAAVSGLRETINALFPRKGGILPTPVSFGNALNKVRDRNIGGRALRQEVARTKQGFRWYVEDLTAADETDDAAADETDEIEF